MWLSKKIGISYSYPADMAKFPTEGTGERDFIVATFKYSDSEGCREARYGILDRPVAAEMTLFFFIAVRTTKVDPITSDFDRKIGDWTAFRVYRKAGGAHGLDTLRTGAYIQCGAEHDSTHGDFDFARCYPTAIASRSAVTGVLDRYFTIRSANASVVRGAAALFQEFNQEVDPAWGRCGALGCCASY